MPEDMDIRLSMTDEYDRLVRFFIENGLEYDEEDEKKAVEEGIDTDIVCSYKLTDQNDRLLGAFCLAKRQGAFIIDGIAVDPEFRGNALGQILLHKAVSMTRSMGGKAIWLVARAPGFFKNNGFVQGAAGEGPVFYECENCGQRGDTCFPEVLVYRI